MTGKVFRSVFDLFETAYERALAATDIEDFDAVQIGITNSEEFENRANIAAKVVDRLGLAGVPAVRSETASSTGAAAFHEACFKIRSGAADRVLVIAGERMRTVTTQEATAILSKTVDPVERRFGFTMPALIALISQVFFDRLGVRGRAVEETLARLMMRAHRFGADNPLAAFSGKPEHRSAYFDEERNLWVATPLRRKDCSPICDGAAAIVLSSAPGPVRVAGLGSATDTSSLLDRAALDRLEASRLAAAFAYREAGIRDPEELSHLVVETHDAFNPLLPLSLVDLGLFRAEQVIEALCGDLDGEPSLLDPYQDPLTGPRGRVPVNLSGGLKARGHPVGGTGLFQIGELFLQLTGAFPNPRAQVPDAQIGLAHSIGGPGNNVYVTVIESARSRRQPSAARVAPVRRVAKCAQLGAEPAELSGRLARIEAATTIHVTADGGKPLQVALLRVGDRRVFARLDAPLDGGEELAAAAGRPARFLVKGDGDHYFQLVQDHWDIPALLRGLHR